MTSSVPFDRVAECYDASRGGEQRARFMADVLSPHLPSSATVVEIGVGTGIVAASLAARGCDVLGVDLAPAMLTRAHQRLGARVVHGDAERLPVATGSAGAAYLVWVLHLVADPIQVLREACRAVRPGGRVVAVPTSWAGLGPAGSPGPDASDLERIQHRLGELRADFGDPEAVTDWMRTAGLDRVEHHSHVDERTQSPFETAELIEQRAWSMLWDVDDATWQRLVVPVIDELRALRDPQRPRLLQQSVSVMVGVVPDR